MLDHCEIQSRYVVYPQKQCHFDVKSLHVCFSVGQAFLSDTHAWQSSPIRQQQRSPSIVEVMLPLSGRSGHWVTLAVPPLNNDPKRG